MDPREEREKEDVDDDIAYRASRRGPGRSVDRSGLVPTMELFPMDATQPLSGSLLAKAGGVDDSFSFFSTSGMGDGTDGSHSSFSSFMAAAENDPNRGTVTPPANVDDPLDPCAGGAVMTALPEPRKVGLGTRGRGKAGKTPSPPRPSGVSARRSAGLAARAGSGGRDSFSPPGLTSQMSIGTDSSSGAAAGDAYDMLFTLPDMSGDGAASDMSKCPSDFSQAEGGDVAEWKKPLCNSHFQGSGDGSGIKPPEVLRAEESVAGNRKALDALRELVVYPFLYARESRLLGLKWPRGLLLYGPPGTGKTSLVRAIVRECNAHLIMINPNSVHRPHAGEGEKFLREAFSEAYSQASWGKPALIFIEELDAICPHRDNRREQGSRIVGQLLTLMDGNKKSSKTLPHVVVVASTNRLDAIDPALRRPGRFDSEVEVTVPSIEERLQILKLYSKNLHLGENVDLQIVAASCNGYVGADLEALYREAARLAYNRMLNSSEGETILKLLMEDWESARALVGASMTRGITKEISTVRWDDIGGLKHLKKKLQQAVEWPIKHAAAFARLGISPARGVLLHGPPGCSKTTLAKAAAHAAQASFFSLSGAELYSKYVGEGEALLRRTFQKARLASPSILFFDEADAIAPKRTGPGGNSNGNVTVGERLLSTLLTEMDGLELATGIIVLAATNRPNAIDAALLRPGRFDMVLYVPPPDVEGRYEILRIHTRKMKLWEDVDLWKIAECTELFTGADLEGLCREAGMVALREDLSARFIRNKHFHAARCSLNASLTKAVVDEYSNAAINGPSTRSKH